MPFARIFLRVCECVCFKEKKMPLPLVIFMTLSIWMGCSGYGAANIKMNSLSLITLHRKLTIKKHYVYSNIIHNGMQFRLWNMLKSYFHLHFPSFGIFLSKTVYFFLLFFFFSSSCHTIRSRWCSSANDCIHQWLLMVIIIGKQLYN